jgi:hypothetical protein
METIASEGAMGTGTTQPDPKSDGSRTTDVDAPSETTEEDPESQGQREGSQWEVVPHGSRANRRSSETNADTAGGESRGGSSIAFVAIIALLVGGAVVFGMRQAGFTLPGQDGDQPRRPVVAKPSNIPPPPDGSQSPTDAEGDPDKANKTGNTKGDPSDPNSEGEAKEGEEGKDAEGADSSKEEDALEAIEQAAEKAVEAREGDGKEGEKKPDDKKSGDPKEGDKTPVKETGPQPKLPDGLAPAPAPPPPPK